MKRVVILVVLLVVFSGISLAKEVDVPETYTVEKGGVLGESATTYIYAGSKLLATKTGEELDYHYQDRLGSDVDSKTLPFGQELVNRERFSFTGKELDEELYYFNARYYDSNLGEFISVDPVKDNHAYSYVSNNPLMFVDPSGMSEVNLDLLETARHTDSLYALPSKDWRTVAQSFRSLGTEHGDIWAAFVGEHRISPRLASTSNMWAMAGSLNRGLYTLGTARAGAPLIIFSQFEYDLPGLTHELSHVRDEIYFPDKTWFSSEMDAFRNQDLIRGSGIRSDAKLAYHIKLSYNGLSPSNPGLTMGEFAEGNRKYLSHSTFLSRASRGALRRGAEVLGYAGAPVMAALILMENDPARANALRIDAANPIAGPWGLIGTTDIYDFVSYGRSNEMTEAGRKSTELGMMNKP